MARPPADARAGVQWWHGQRIVESYACQHKRLLPPPLLLLLARLSFARASTPPPLSLSLSLCARALSLPPSHLIFLSTSMYAAVGTQGVGSYACRRSASLVPCQPPRHESKFHNHGHVVRNQEIASRINVCEPRFILGERNRHVIVQDAVKTNPLDAKVSVGHSNVLPPILPQRERTMTRTHAAFPVLVKGG